MKIMPSKKKLSLGVCYICKHEFLRSSIHIHETQCLRKWKRKNDSLPEKERLPVPVRPFEMDNEEWDAMVRKEKARGDIEKERQEQRHHEREKDREQQGRARWNKSTRDPEMIKSLLQKSKVSDDTVLEHSSNKTENLIETDQFAAFDVSPPSPEPVELPEVLHEVGATEKEKSRRGKLADKWRKLSTLPRHRTPTPTPEDGGKSKPKLCQGRESKSAQPVRVTVPHSAKRQPNKAKAKIEVNDRKQSKSPMLMSRIDHHNALPNKLHMPTRSNKEKPVKKMPDAGASGTLGNRTVFLRQQNALKKHQDRQNEAKKKKEEKGAGKEGKEFEKEDAVIIPVKKTESTHTYIIAYKDVADMEDFGSVEDIAGSDTNSENSNEVTGEINKGDEVTTAQEGDKCTESTHGISKKIASLWHKKKPAKKEGNEKAEAIQNEKNPIADQPSKSKNMHKDAAVNTDSEAEETPRVAQIEEFKKILDKLSAEVEELKASKGAQPKIDEVVKTIQTVEEKSQANVETMHEEIDSISKNIKKLTEAYERTKLLYKQVRNPVQYTLWKPKMINFGKA